MKKDMTPQDYLKRIMTEPVSDDCPVRRTLELFIGSSSTRSRLM